MYFIRYQFLYFYFMPPNLWHCLHRLFLVPLIFSLYLLSTKRSCMCTGDPLQMIFYFVAGKQAPVNRLLPFCFCWSDAHLFYRIAKIVVKYFIKTVEKVKFDWEFFFSKLKKKDFYRPKCLWDWDIIWQYLLNFKSKFIM